MIHGKQFAIMEKLWAGEGYEHISLSDGMILSFHKDLPIAVSSDKNTILLGHAWNAYEDGEDPASAISHLRGEALLKAECAWCGRYVLLSDGVVYTDTSASLPVFYAQEGIASDILFLVEAGEYKRNDLRLEAKTKWFPGPVTAYDGISRLLPSQSYDYRAKKNAFRYTLSENIPKDLPYEELRDRYYKIARSSSVNMHRHFGSARIIVALTGGYDSRLSFAALKSIGEEYPFSAYTLEHDNISHEDLEWPPVICEAAHVPFYFGRREKGDYSDERYAQYTEHVSGMVLEEDQLFYAYGQYAGLLKDGEEGVLVRSSLVTLAYASPAQQHAVDTKVNRDDFFAHYEIDPKSKMAQAFDIYFDWTQAHPLPFSDTHRFYWEQKMACWSAENDRGYDIYDHLTPIQMGNCRDMVTLLLYMPEERRRNKAHQAELTAMLCPEIADIPYGSGQGGAGGKLGKVIEAGKKAWKKVQKIGLKRTVQYYFNKVVRK